MRWCAVCPVLLQFVLLSCVRHPVGILFVSVDVRSVNYRTGKIVSWAITACAFCGRSTNVLSVTYTVHIRSVRVTCTSITRTLVGRSLSVTCLVRMRSLRLLRRQVPPLRRLPSPDEHFMQIFCPFGVR